VSFGLEDVAYTEVDEGGGKRLLDRRAACCQITYTLNKIV
jgi:hypothetical protein